MYPNDDDFDDELLAEQQAMVESIVILQRQLDAQKAWVLSGVIPTNDSRALFGTNSMIVDQLSITGDMNELLDRNFAVPEGYWIHFQSTYVHRAGWWETGYILESNVSLGSMFVEYLDLSVFRYDNTSMTDWQDMISSISHGRYAYYVLHKWASQTMLRTSQRKVTKEMRERNFNRTSA